MLLLADALCVLWLLRRCLGIQQLDAPYQGLSTSLTGGKLLRSFHIHCPFPNIFS